MSNQGLSRRETLIGGAASPLLLAAASATGPRAAITAADHWAVKGDVKLYVYRKHLRARSARPRPILFLVHGSSFSGRGGYDLQVPGHPGYSMMDWFAERGFDVWTMDHEGYGRSTRTGRYSDVASGADDLDAAFRLIERETRQKSLMVYSQSAGALRGGVFAMRSPERVERLILDGFTYTGNGAPEIMRRRANVGALRASPYRTADSALYSNIFSRDDPSTVEPAVPEALARYELALGNRVPNGTYLDMATKLPLVDPERLTMPVQIIRAAHDGNATDAELLEFFSKLPSRDRQFVMIDGVAHVAVSRYQPPSRVPRDGRISHLSALMQNHLAGFVLPR